MKYFTPKNFIKFYITTLTFCLSARRVQVHLLTRLLTEAEGTWNLLRTWKVGMFDADGKETTRGEEIIRRLFFCVVGDDSKTSGNDCAVVVSLLCIFSANISSCISCRTVLGYAA